MPNTPSAAGEGLLLELTSEIVAAYVKNHVLPITELNALIADVHSALSATSTFTAAEVVVEKQKPAVPVRKSIQDDEITCLECGQGFKSLKRHLMTNHSQTPDEYREKWALLSDYPMVSPVYAEARSRLAKESGLGQSRRRTRQ